MSATTARLQPAQLRQILWLTLGAIALYLAQRALPTGTNLHQGDFRVEGGGTQLEFCDPSNPQFLPVVAVRSPIVTTLRPLTAPAIGEPTGYVLTLATAGGKPIGPVDLLVAHTRKLHLMVVDPTLADYQHLHPEPGANPGEWTFTLTPRLAGNYRVFADFTPVATGRGLYASADFAVPGEVPVNLRILNWTAERDGLRHELRPDAKIIRAGQPARLIYTVTAPDGGPVKLEPVMDAYAHLVAFDRDRGGFAHLHPQALDPLQPPEDPRAPQLEFTLTIPEPGLYVIWAQIQIDGAEHFTPFWFEVTP
ncbi:MAG: hypothetical protein ABII82_14450 [Verrucomicrobiota bacterium]